MTIWSYKYRAEEFAFIIVPHYFRKRFHLVEIGSWYDCRFITILRYRMMCLHVHWKWTLACLLTYLLTWLSSAVIYHWCIEASVASAAGWFKLISASPTVGCLTIITGRQTIRTVSEANAAFRQSGGMMWTSCDVATRPWMVRAILMSLWEARVGSWGFLRRPNKSNKIPTVWTGFYVTRPLMTRWKQLETIWRREKVSDLTARLSFRFLPLGAPSSGPVPSVFGLLT